MKSFFVALICLVALSTSAQTEVKAEDAKNHVGETVRVCTVIYGGRFIESDSLTLLNAGGAYPNQFLTIVIRGNARNEFNKPEEYYKGSHVCITGTITLYRDKPQIEVTAKDQIKEDIKDHTNQEPK